jgi:hypothetical protein
MFTIKSWPVNGLDPVTVSGYGQNRDMPDNVLHTCLFGNLVFDEVEL